MQASELFGQPKPVITCRQIVEAILISYKPVRISTNNNG